LKPCVALAVTLVALASTQAFSQTVSQQTERTESRTPTPASIVAALESGDFEARRIAARTVAATPELQKHDGVKAAVLTTLKAQTTTMTAHYADRRDGAVVDTRSPSDADAEGEALLALTAAAATLEAPDVLSALLPVVCSGSIPENRIAKFGLSAVDPLIAIYRSGVGAGSANLVRSGALRTLAIIARAELLSGPRRTQLTDVAREAVRAPNVFVVSGGIYLGVAVLDREILTQAQELRERQISGNSTVDLDQRFLKSVATKALALSGVR